MATISEGEALARALGKPPIYTGLEGEWEEWIFIVRMYAGINVPIPAQTLLDVESTRGSLINDNLGPTHRVLSEKLFYILATCTRGSANLTIRSAGIGEGYVAWRRLHDRFASPTAGKNFATLQTILKPPVEWPKDAVAWEEALIAWELLIGRWEQQAIEILSDAIKIQVVVAQAPKEIRTQIMLQNHVRYHEVREAITSYLSSSRTWKPSELGPTSSHMDVDLNAVYGGCKGGKGKGKDGYCPLQG